VLRFLIRAEEHVADKDDKQEQDDNAKDIDVAGEQASDLITDPGDRIGQTILNAEWKSTFTWRGQSSHLIAPIAAITFSAHTGLRIKQAIKRDPQWIMEY
jgi:hypothetical protein